MVGPEHQPDDVGSHQADEGDGAAHRDGRAGCQRRSRQQHGTGHADPYSHGTGLVVAQHEQVQVTRHQHGNGGRAEDERSGDTDVLPRPRVESPGKPEQYLAQGFVIRQEDDDRGDDRA